MNTKQMLALTLARRKILFIKARRWYYNRKDGQLLMTDEQFDALEDSIKADDPKWEGLKKTGAVTKKAPIALKNKMPSLNKKYPTEVGAWLDAHASEFICISNKLDGTSLQLNYRNGNPVECFTRGDGVIGKNVSFLIPHLRIPKKIRFKGDLSLRCEGIFTQAAFQKYKGEGEDQFESDRGAASGVMNRTAKDIHPALRDLKLVVVTVLVPWGVPSKALTAVKRMGFDVVSFARVPASKLNPENLSSAYAKQKKASHFKLDGLVLMLDKVNPKLTAEKPKWAIAFKENTSVEDAPQAKVIAVHWKISPHGYWIPKIEIEPTYFDGAKVRFATSHNARWMWDRGIGPGAVVKLVRSGEIIPKIVGVVRKAKFQGPPKTGGKIEWDANETHLRLVDPNASEAAAIGKILRFFQTLNVDFIGKGVAAKLYEGGLNSIIKILRAEPRDFMKIEGFQERGAQRLYDSIQGLFTKGTILPLLMDASGSFPRGFGERRGKKILAVYPNLQKLADMGRRVVIQKVSEIPGYNTTTATMFADGLDDFLRFFKKLGIKVQAREKVAKKSSKLEGMGITFTGFRDADAEQVIKENGGEVVSFGGSTSVLLYSESGKESSKVDKARAKGLKVMTWPQFEKKYL